MGDAPARRCLIAVEYTAARDMLEDIEELLARHGAFSERSADGCSLYAVRGAKDALEIRNGVHEISLRRPGDALRVRWNSEADMEEAPEEAHIQGGAFTYPGAQDLVISWTGRWPDPAVRIAANAALRALFERLDGIHGMRGAEVTLQVGKSQARASASGGMPAGQAAEGDAPGRLQNEHFTRLLAQGI
ncbi:MAG TPA: hypothetical protein VLA21_03330 [Candidatus Limnocylindria bacterium]|nr:hypothetical protein [Candidatus Limnocylindria bacterium]